MTNQNTQVLVEDNLDTLFGKLNEALSIVSSKLIEVAPEAAEALLTLVQFKGGFSLALGFLFLGLTLLGIRMVSKIKLDRYGVPENAC